MAPDWSVILTVVGMIFTAGLTWGVVSNQTKASEKRIETLLGDFRLVLTELKTLSTDLQVLRNSAQRSEEDIAAIELRLRELEIVVAKLQSYRD